MTDSILRTRLDMLRATIPTAEHRRTARGLLRTCRELGDHIQRARQLYALASAAADRQAVDDLIAEIDGQRASLADHARLATRAREDRAERLVARRWLPEAPNR